MQTGRDLQSFELCPVPAPAVPAVEGAPRDVVLPALSAELGLELPYLHPVLTTSPFSRLKDLHSHEQPSSPWGCTGWEWEEGKEGTPQVTPSQLQG